MNNIDIQVVEYGSVLQKRSVDLRYRILREPLGLQYTEAQLAEEKEEIHIIAIRDGKVLGVLLLRRMNDDVLKMRQVAVDASLQRTGIGKQMVRFSERYAAARQYKMIELHARDTAKAFYLALNYEITGNPFMEVGILHYKMIKTLPK